MMMDVVEQRCAALDVHKRQVRACARTPDGTDERRELVREFPTFTRDLEALAGWLSEQGVTKVAMEATGSYWKPVWQVLEDAGFELLLVNARHVKQVPGRKTDVADAVWLCRLLEAGLLSGSFVPPPVIRQLRDLTRYRTRLTQDRTREIQRVEKVLEDAAIKLGAVASSTLSKSGRAMIEALIAGERDPDVLAGLAKGRMRVKIPELVRALHGRFAEHHARLLRLHLDHIDHLEAAITTLDDQIDEVIAPFAVIRDRLRTIPGIDKRVAEILIAEIGVDMTVFATAAHLASWAGVCPGHHESAGKRHSGKTRRGDRWLISALVQAAWAAARTRDTYLHAQFWRLARRRGKKRAAVAVAHSILVAVWHMLTNDVDYHDLGGDFFTQHDTAKRTRHHIRQLEALGYHVTLEHAA